MDEEKKENSKGDWGTKENRDEENEDSQSEKKSWENDEDSTKKEDGIETKPKEKYQK